MHEIKRCSSTLLLIAQNTCHVICARVRVSICCSMPLRVCNIVVHKSLNLIRSKLKAMLSILDRSDINSKYHDIQISQYNADVLGWFKHILFMMKRIGRGLNATRALSWKEYLQGNSLTHTVIQQHEHIIKIHNIKTCD